MNDRGMLLHVLRPADGTDCTMGGVTSNHSKLTLVGILDDTVRPRANYAPPRSVTPLPRESRIFTASDDAPAVALVIRWIGAKIAHLVPVELNAAGDWCELDSWVMSGGNYASTSDSRVGNLITDMTGHRFYGALNVHDRIER